MYFKVVILNFSFLFLIVGSVSSGEEALLPEYTILCTSEKRTGLDWVNGDWQQAQFKNTTRLVVKAPSNDCGSQAQS
jgi:hypothetical protein